MTVPYDSRKIQKILLIGDSNTGKSSLLERFTRGTFPRHHMTTIGVDFQRKTLHRDGDITRLQVWDTAGQERFRTITAPYYRHAHGIIIVYDVTCRISFENATVWLREAQRYTSPGVKTMLVGNKCDLRRKRAVPYAAGHDRADELGVDCFMETSAKTEHNVHHAFDKIAREMRASFTGPSPRSTLPVVVPLAPKDHPAVREANVKPYPTFLWEEPRECCCLRLLKKAIMAASIF